MLKQAERPFEAVRHTANNGFTIRHSQTFSPSAQLGGAACMQAGISNGAGTDLWGKLWPSDSRPGPDDIVLGAGSPSRSLRRAAVTLSRRFEFLVMWQGYKAREGRCDQFQSRIGTREATGLHIRYPSTRHIPAHDPISTMNSIPIPNSVSDSEDLSKVGDSFLARVFGLATPPSGYSQRALAPSPRKCQLVNHLHTPDSTHSSSLSRTQMSS